MLHTEMNYVDDLKMVLSGYRDKLEMSSLKMSMSLKTDMIFGNLDEIWDFHADTLLPLLESCQLNPTLIAKTFLEYSQHLTRMYCRYIMTNILRAKNKKVSKMMKMSSGEKNKRGNYLKGESKVSK